MNVPPVLGVWYNWLQVGGTADTQFIGICRWLQLVYMSTSGP
jgi:hypothetical protein